MPIPPRVSLGGFHYHVFNRAVSGQLLFPTNSEFSAFETLLLQAKLKFSVRILSYSLMPNHWHFILCPLQDGELSKFIKWVQITHVRRNHLQHKTVGRGHLYQSRFKSVLIEKDDHFLAACRYVERNPVEAGLVERAENWRWGSARVRGPKQQDFTGLLDPWPRPVPKGWLEWIQVGAAEKPPGMQRQQF